MRLGFCANTDIYKWEMETILDGAERRIKGHFSRAFANLVNFGKRSFYLRTG